MRRLRFAALLVGIAGCAPTPQADYRAARYAEAAQGFGARVGAGDTTAQAAYNLATAQIRLGEHAAARGALESAASRAPTPDLRFAAHFNAGLTDLAPALAAARVDSATRVALRRVITRYRAALRLEPGNRDAKWNLELAERLLRGEPPPPPDESGGGDDQREAPSGGGSPSGPAERDPGNPQLSRADAERILAEADREERAVQRRRLRAAPASERPARDW